LIFTAFDTLPGLVCSYGLNSRTIAVFSIPVVVFAGFFLLLRPVMEQEQKLKIEEDIVKMLKTVYDPELPVDVYSLGLIYKIDLNDDGHVDIDMTLTAPNCPIADFIFEDVRQKVESVDGVTSATVNLVFEPEWDPRMMTDEAKLELGMM
jgi:FeS assembly SUF system protein